MPHLTIIGSSNFGYRSVYRDLEAQLVIHTQNKVLQKKLHQVKNCKIKLLQNFDNFNLFYKSKEQIGLFEKSELVTESLFTNKYRVSSLWLKIFTKFVKSYF